MPNQESTEQRARGRGRAALNTERATPAAGLASRPAQALLMCLLTALPFLSSCASVSEMETMKSTVDNLRIEALNQKKELTDLRAKLSDTSKDTTTLKEYSFSALKESQASLVGRTDDLSREVQVLKGRFEESKYFMDKTVKDLLSDREMQQAKMSYLEGRLLDIKTRLDKSDDKKQAAPPEKAPGPGTPKEGAAAPAGAGEGVTAEGADPQRFYDDAQIDLQEKRYAEAGKKFEDFTKSYPDHLLVPNAFFFIGESFFAEKKYEEAILAYESLLKKFPRHDKVRAAMLNQAYAFIGMGDNKTGKVILERLIEKYPRSEEAASAEEKIGELLSKKNAPATKGKGRKKK